MPQPHWSFSTQPVSPQTAGTNFPQAIQVTARDGQGNVATTFSETVTLAITGGTGTAGATLTGTTAIAASSGVATFNASTIQVDSAGTGYTLTASAPTPSNGVSTAFAVDPGAAATLHFTTEPVNTAAGAIIGPPVVVTARDGVGNTATGFSGSVSLALGGGDAGATLGGTSSQSASSGVATFNNLTVDLVGTAYTLTASATGPSNGVSANFDITAGAAATLEFSIQPATPQTAGTAFPQAIEITARDGQGNVATGFSETVTLAITNGTGTTGATLTGTTGVAAASGVATFTASSVQIDSAGRDTRSQPALRLRRQWSVLVSTLIRVPPPPWNSRCNPPQSRLE